MKVCISYSLAYHSTLFGLAVVSLLLSTLSAIAHSVHFQKQRALNVPINLLIVDLNDPTIKVSVELAAGFLGRDEPFMAMVQRSGAQAAVTGTYFCTTSLYPIGDIVIDGRQRYFGGMGTALAITPSNEAIFRRVPYGRHQSWNGFETVIAAGPTLLRNGDIDLHPREERFGDPHVLSRAARTAAGWTPSNKLLFVAILQPLSLHELAKILRRLGCVHAINLDGGSSTALYYAGAPRVRPQRRLVNIIVIQSGIPSSLRFALPPDTKALRTRQRLEYAATLYERGEAAALRKQWNLAIEHLRTASRLASDNASYYVALADALNAVGRHAERSTVLAEAGRAYMRKGAFRQAGRNSGKHCILTRLIFPHGDFSLKCSQCLERQSWQTCRHRPATHYNWP